jgi:hypothetical protein
MATDLNRAGAPIRVVRHRSPWPMATDAASAGPGGLPGS